MWVVLGRDHAERPIAAGVFVTLGAADLWHDRRMDKQRKSHRRLTDAYAVPGFRPLAFARGVFGDLLPASLSWFGAQKKVCGACSTEVDSGILDRGLSEQGLASRPISFCSLCVAALLTMTKPNENLSSISCCHYVRSEAGVMIMKRRMHRLRTSSARIRPASMVLPRPTSSANSNDTRNMRMARANGTSWKSPALTAP